MTLPATNLGLSTINNELRFGTNRQTSVSEYFVNVLEHDQPRDVQWARLRNQTSSVTLNMINGPASGGSMTFNIADYYNYYEPGDIFSVDLMMNGWGGNMEIQRLFFNIAGGITYSTLVPNYTKRHTFNFVASGTSVGCSWGYSGRSTNNPIGNQGFGKLNYWAPGTATPGAVANLGNDWNTYAAQYYNNIL